MAIRILRNNNGNCITFVGSSQPAYWNACLSGQVNDDDNTRVDVINDIRTTDADEPVFEFFGVPFTEFQDGDGNSFADAQACADYITENANVIGGAIVFTAQDTIDFTRDQSLTSIATSLGDTFAVNGIKAAAAADGTITISENSPNGVDIYRSITPGNITVEGESQSLTLTGLVNTLNSFFCVTPIGAGADDVFTTSSYVQQTPQISGFGDVTITTNVATKGTNSGSNLNDGFYTIDLPINAPGEYFYWDNTGQDAKRKVIIGLLETSKFAGANTLEAISSSGELLDLAVRLGPSAAYENSDYGVIIEKGFYEQPQRSDIFRAGINADSRLFIDHLNDDEWQTVARSAFPITDGEEYMFVVHLNKENATANTGSIRTYSLASDVAISYRYIESPDGSFFYPLFSGREEADYVSQNANTIFGSPYVNDANTNSEGYYSHAHVFVDEPTNTTWYMPDNYAFHAANSAPVSNSTITYTEIPTLADAGFAPAQFTSSDYTFAELASVNISIPTDAAYTTSVTGLPPCLTYSAGYITGTADPVPEDESYTISVTRSNGYGSSVGTFTINIQDNASLGNLAGFTELDGNFYQPNRLVLTEDAVMQYDTTLSPGEEMTYSYSSGGNNPPTIGILSSTGQTNFDAYDAANGDVLGSGSYDYATSHSLWDLRYVSFGGDIGSNKSRHNLIGFANNTPIQGTEGDNHDVTFKLEYDLSDNYIRLYRGSSLLLTSANTFTGAQTITFAGFDDQAQSDVYVPSNLTIINSSYGSTQPPSGFENPLLEGAMATATLMGEAPDEDAAVQLTQTLPVNHRMVFPQTWVETNVLPYIPDLGDDVFIGIPVNGAGWGDVGSADFDALFKLDGQATASHRSAILTQANTGSSTTVNSITDAYYDYALEWDGTDLHVIACNIGDINTQPAINAGGSFSRTATEPSYANTAAALDVVLGVDGGAQINLSTSGISAIRTPFGINDIVVGEGSAGNGQFKQQPAAAAFDDASTGGHVPSGYGFGFSGITTLNAGTTYRFIYHPSLETDDKIEFRYTSNNAVYTAGQTTFGSGDPSTTAPYKGIEFAVPTDAPPLTLYYYNGNNTTYDGGRAIAISGSTYVAPVSGVTKEGPASNQTGTNTIFDANDFGWLSIDETLGAGQRLVMNTTFLADLVDAMPDGSQIKIGLKDTGWAATTADTNFEGALRFVIDRTSSTDVDLRTWSGASSTTLINTSLADITTNNIAAVLELTNSGNNIRFGIRSDLVNNSNSTSSTAYADWNTSYRVSTGNQGYGISTIDIMILGRDTGAGTDMDAGDIVWTNLSEISTPAPAVTLTTNWTKAIHVNGGSESMRQEHNGSDGALYQGSGTVALPSAGNTASSSRPWAMGFVFQHAGATSSDQTIIGQAEGGTGTGDVQLLKIMNSSSGYGGYLQFEVGKGGSECVARIGSSALASNTWYGIYMDFNGARLSASDATSSNLSAAYRFKMIDLSTGGVTTLSQTWTTTGNKTDGTASGYNVVGARLTAENSNTKWAGVVMTTLRSGQSLPTDTEISAMVRDPLQWRNDYKNGNPWRLPSATSDHASNFDATASKRFGTQIWLMGDGTNDAYAVMRNQVDSSDQNDSPLRMLNMVSNDIETVSITGLT